MTPTPVQTRAILVTGASSGIGAATARLLAAEGRAVVLLARRRERLEALCAELAEPERHVVAACDVTDPAAVELAFATVAERCGALDGLVANAGVGAFGPLAELPERDLERVIDTNLTGLIRCVRAAIPLLRRPPLRPRGIVLIASSAGRRGFPGLAVYSATKAALYGLADALRLELAADSIRTTVVAPTVTRTEFFERASGPAPAPAPGAMSPEAVAQAIVRALRDGPAAVDLKPFGRLLGALNVLAPGALDRRLARRLRR